MPSLSPGSVRLDRLHGCPWTGLGAALAAALSAAPGAAAPQVGPWTERVVTYSAPGTTSLCAADFDGDGDADFVGAQVAGTIKSIVLYANDGDGTTWTPRVLALEGAMSVDGHDVDGDGDEDVLSVGLDGELFWYENELEAGGGFVTRLIHAGLPFARKVRGADLDGDGDGDALQLGPLDLVWRANTVGDGTVWVAQGAVSLDSVKDFALADVDGDGDLDVMASTTQLGWQENVLGDGTTWTMHGIAGAVPSTLGSIAPADVDGDGDVDVVFHHGFQTEWYRNDDGSGSVWTPDATIAVDGATNKMLAMVDLDVDGDLDLVSGSRATDELAWYENHAHGIAWTEHPVALGGGGLSDLAPADVDGDAAIDLVIGSAFHGTFAWVENLTRWVPYGCGVNPLGSLRLGSAPVEPGSTLWFVLDNPLDTQRASSLPFLAVAAAPDAAFPCGALVPGLGMTGPGAVGELLIDAIPSSPLAVLPGPSWSGPAIPIPLVVPPTAAGRVLHAQGLLLDPVGSVRFGLTNALRLEIGP